MSQPTVLVLAGGASNRFWPLRHKPLLRFGAYSLLERHLRQLRDLGCQRFIVVVRPETRAAVEAIDLGAGCRLDLAVQAEASGMADAVLAAAAALQAAGDGPLYVTQAQDVVEARLHAELLQRWSQRDAALSGLIAAVPLQDYFPGGYLTLQGERVTGVVEKPGAGREPSNLVNLVAHLFASTSALLAALRQETARPGRDDAYERALTALMAAGEFRAQVYDGRWRALKYPWHALDVVDLLLELWAGGSESPGAEYTQVQPGVFQGRDVRIFDGANVVAPALLDHGVVLGHDSLVRSSIVGPGCVVGFGSEVARSLLVQDVELHHNYVGDSVLDAGAALGYGAVTANFRLDSRSVPSVIAGERIDSGRIKLGAMLGAGARLGVNASVMPGVKLGAGAILGPNLALAHDLQDGERYLGAP